MQHSATADLYYSLYSQDSRLTSRESLEASSYIDWLRRLTRTVRTVHSLRARGS